MKRIAYPALLVLLFSCGQASTSSEAVNSDTAMAKAPEEKIFDYPVINKNWQIGNHQNTRLVLQVYKAWDKKSLEDMKALLADTVIMDLPNGVRRSASNAETVKRLLKQRSAIGMISWWRLVYPLLRLPH